LDATCLLSVYGQQALGAVCATLLGCLPRASVFFGLIALSLLRCRQAGRVWACVASPSSGSGYECNVLRAVRGRCDHCGRVSATVQPPVIGWLVGDACPIVASLCGLRCSSLAPTDILGGVWCRCDRSGYGSATSRLSVICWRAGDACLRVVGAPALSRRSLSCSSKRTTSGDRPCCVLGCLPSSRPGRPALVLSCAEPCWWCTHLLPRCTTARLRLP
jgi:hypothetical protein